MAGASRSGALYTIAFCQATMWRWLLGETIELIYLSQIPVCSMFTVLIVNYGSTRTQMKVQSHTATAVRVSRSKMLVANT